MKEAEIVLQEVLNLTRADIYAQPHLPLEKEQAIKIANILKQRITGTPLAYILGKFNFMDFDFLVTPDVLIPRPETEILVEKVIEYLGKDFKGKILELGTGSGCIAVSLAKFLALAKITATDISEKALRVALKNSLLYRVRERITFICADLFDGLKPQEGYDLCVFNPPYIASKDLPTLQPEVQKEPFIALDGKEDGLDFYRRIIPKAASFLTPQGILIFEIGFNQKEKIEEIIHRTRSFKILQVIKDYQDFYRIIVARKEERWTS